MSKKKPVVNIGRLVKIVDNIETKLVFAESSSALESLVKQYLIKIISLFNFNDEKLRNKLNAIVNSFFVRIKSDESVKLPTSDISSLMIKQRKNPFILNLSLLFFDIAFQREPNQRECLSSFFVGIRGLPETLQKNLVHKVFIIIDKNPIPVNPTEKRKFYEIFQKHNEDRKILLDFFLSLLFVENMKDWNSICGTKDKQEEIFKKKVNIFKFITNSEFSMTEIFPHCIIGESINARTISNLCEEFLKKRRALFDVNDNKIVQLLFKFFFGKLPYQKRDSTETEKRVIMKYLCRSRYSTEVYLCVKIVLKKTLFEYQASHKLRILGCEYINFCLKNGFQKASRMSNLELGTTKLKSEVEEEVEGEEEEEKKKMKNCSDLFGKENNKFILGIFMDFCDLVRDLLTGQSVLRQSRGYEVLRFKKTIFPMYSNFLKLFPEYIDKLSKFGFSTIELYFSEIKNENSQIKLVLQTSLGLMMIPYRFYIEYRDDNDKVNLLKRMFQKLLKEIIVDSKFFESDEVDDSRENMIYSALYCVNRLFSFEDPLARILNIAQVSNLKLQIREEAKRGVSIKSFKSMFSSYSSQLFKKNMDEKYPDFSKFILRVKKFADQENLIFSDLSVVYLCKFVEDLLLENTKDKNIKVKDFISLNNGYDFAIDEFLQFLFTSLNQTDIVISEVSKFCLFLIQEDRQSLTLKLSKFVQKMEKILFCGNGKSRKLIAKLYSFVYVNECVVDEKKKDRFYNEILMKNFRATDSSLGNLQSVIYISSYFATFWFHQQKSVDIGLRGLIDQILLCLTHQKEMISVSACEALGYLGMNNILSVVFEPLNGKIKSEEVKIESGSDLGNFREESLKKRRKIGDISSLVGVLVVLLNIVRSASIERSTKKNSRSIPKLEEEIIKTFGKLCHPKVILFEESNTSDEMKSIFDIILPELLKYRYSKNTEIQFTIGESFSCLCGFSTLYNSDSFIFDYRETEEELKIRKIYLKKILSKVISEGALSPQSIVRQNTSIWLVSIVKHCKKSEIIREYVYDFQEAFSRLITDHTNRITASAASRGLTYTYQIGVGDNKLQKELIKNLMDTFSGKTYYRGELLIIEDLDYQKNEKKNEEKVDEESMTDARDKSDKEKKTSSERKDIPSSYKELVRIANEIGDPTLVYKFLNISNQNQIWNSKRAAAFSTLTILQNTTPTEEMKKIFPKIFPKLFLYQFDPNKDVSDCMGDMVIQYSEMENKAIPELVAKCVDPIIQEINKNLHVKFWRNRYSALKAFSMLISYPGRTFDEMEKSILEIMEKVFSLTDDIKENVSKLAAKILFSEISKFLLKCFNFKHSSSKESPSSLSNCVKLVFPFLLNKGLSSAISDCFLFSLVTIMKIMEIYKDQDISVSKSEILTSKKKNYKLLFAPYIPLLIENLLQLMSHGGESGKIQQLGSNIEQFGISKEEFNEVRIKASSSIQSPIHESLSICIRFICKENLEEIIHKLISLIQNSTGVLTRVHTVRIVSSIAKSNEKDLIPKQTTRLLNCIFSFIEDDSQSSKISMNEKKEMAICVSYLLNSASNMRKKDIIDGRIMEIFFMSENRAKRIQGPEGEVEENNSRIIGHMVNSIQSRAHEVFENPSFYKSFILIIYFGVLTDKLIIQQELDLTKSSIYSDNFFNLFGKKKKIVMNRNDHSLVNQFWLSPTLEIQNSEKGGNFNVIDEEDDPDELREDVKIFRKLWREQLMDSEPRTLESFFDLILEKCYFFLDHRTYVYRKKGSLGIIYLVNCLFKRLQYIPEKAEAESNSSQEKNYCLNRIIQVSLIRKILGYLKKTKLVYFGKEFLMKALGILCNRFIKGLSSASVELDDETVFFGVFDFLCSEMKRKKNKRYLIETLQTLQLVLLNKEILNKYFCSEKKNYSDEVVKNLEDILSDLERKEEKEEKERLERSNNNNMKKKKRKVRNNDNFGFERLSEKRVVSKIDDRIKVKVFECFGLIIGENRFNRKILEYLVDKKLELLKTQQLTNSERFGLFFSYLLLFDKIVSYFENKDLLGEREFFKEVLFKLKNILVYNLSPENVSFFARKGTIRIFQELFIPVLRRLNLVSCKKKDEDPGKVIYIQELRDILDMEKNHELKDILERLKNKILMGNSF